MHTLSFRSRLEYDSGKVGIDVPVIIATEWVSMEVVAKLDTGASHCVFRREIAELLGLDLESGVPMRIGTLTGSFDVFGHQVRVGIDDIMVDATVFFATDPAIRRNVLGRRGFIDRLRLGVVDYDGVLLASAYDDPTE